MDKPYNYTPATMDDQQIKDGLCAVATLSDNSKTKDSYFVVGGMAVQSYIPSVCRRPTSDIDIAVLAYLNRARFEDYSRSVNEYLLDKGYKVSHRKFRRSFGIDFRNEEGNSNFVSIPRHSENSFRNIERILDREIRNARRKIIEGTTDTYVVATPEDIIIRKLARSVNRLSRNPTFERYVTSMSGLTREGIEEKISHLNRIRERVFSNSAFGVKVPGESEEFLRFLSDLFDIRILSELGGINKGYFNEALVDWNTFLCDGEDHQKEWRIGLVSRAVLPQDLAECSTLH